jgi:hypothetical protein
VTSLYRCLTAAIALFAFCTAATAQTDGNTQGDLYKAETIVTGTQESERLRGFAIGAAEVLVKLTGEPRFATIEQGKALIARAPELIADYTYEDRMKDIPIHDEQGTRDRPYFLRMRFDLEKFDKALRDAKFNKWTGPRPVVAVWLGISEPRGKYVLTHSDDEGYTQREVLKDASKKAAIPVVLPPDGQSEVTYQDIAKRDWKVLGRASKRLGANAALYGTMDFDGTAFWNCRWVLQGDGVGAQWESNGVTFDQAFKEAINRVAGAHARRAAHSEGQNKK